MTGAHRRVPRLPDDDWLLCPEADCTGIALAEADGHCLQHASAQQATRALARMREDRVYDLRGTTVPAATVAQILTWPYQDGIQRVDDAHRLDLTTLPEERYDLRNCFVTGSVRLGDARIARGHLDLSGAVFDHVVNLSGARILARVVCEGTRFIRGAKFKESQFDGSVWFVSAEFDAGADFTEAAFTAATSFHGSQVTGELAFSGATFAGRTDFDRVRTHWRDYSDKHALLDLSDTVFERRVTADLGTDVVCDGARFEAGLDLRLSGQRLASLRGVRFAAASTVTGVHRVNLDADVRRDRDDAATDGPVPARPTPPWGILQPNARFRPPRLLSLQDTDVEMLSLADVDLGHCLFAGAHNLDKLRLEGPIRFAHLPARGFRTVWNWPVVWRWSHREVIREEYLWRMGRLDPADKGFGYWAQKFELAHAGRVNPARHIELITGERLAALYRSLRKAREDAKDEPGAGDFYYGEQEARRGSHSTRPHERWLLTVYWALSGYGQRASRALAALAALMVTLTVLLTGLGLADTAPVQHITGILQPTTPAPPQVITFDVTGQRVTATLPATTAGAQPVTLDVSATAPTLPPPDRRWTAARAQQAIRTLLTSLAPIAAEQRLTITGAYIVFAARVLGAFLLGLAVLAIRARVKR